MKTENELRRELHSLYNRLLAVRDRIKAIADGEIKRDRCLTGQIYPGNRPLKLKDARQIAMHAYAALNQIGNELGSILE